MENVHQLIVRHGKLEAKKLLGEDSHLADIAAEVMSDDSGRLSITYSGFCLTALPHRDPRADTWRRDGHRITLLIETGRERDESPIGIPFGARARMILLYLQTQALQNNSPVVELGRSMHAWLDRMGLSIGGATYRHVSEQARRISSCRLTFFRDDGNSELRHNGSFVENAISFNRNTDTTQGELWHDTVELNATFFKALKDHPVPLQETALRQISGKSMALDIYIWLAYRLHSLNKATLAPWPALYGQFGGGYKALKQFKPEFIRNLKLATAAYPEARLELPDQGLIMHPSKPPVPRLLG